MIDGVKVIAMTPCGRKRYMDLLAANVVNEHERGVIDEWVLFDNPYNSLDVGYAQQLAARYPWIKVLRHSAPGDLKPQNIYECYQYLTETNCVYLRLDDDLVYFAPGAIIRLIKYRLENLKPFLVYPTIIGNTRTSYQLHKTGKIPETWGYPTHKLCDPLVWQDQDFIVELHQKALASIDAGSLEKDFSLPSNDALVYDDGNISINCFAILGEDMVKCKVTPDEETYLSLSRPMALHRHNARCGNAIVVHFAYHTQTVTMDLTGMLGDYARLVKPISRTRILPRPPKGLRA